MLRKLLIAVGGTFALILAARRLFQLPARPRHRLHRTETETEYQTARHRILIAGAGFGGIHVALELDKQLRGRDDVNVLVVDRDNTLFFTPLLWTVADGRSAPGDVVVPIRAFQGGRSFHVLQAEIERIDLGSRQVFTSAGARAYDRLVIALGSVTAIPDLPGLREHAILFRTPADALALRNHLIDAIEAAHHTRDPQERQALLTFVVGGGGDTGVELAATIHDYLQSGLFADYPWLATAPWKVVVVGRADRLVPMSQPRTSKLVEEELERQGIEVLTGVSVEGVTDSAVQTSAGEIPAKTMFWAAGITAPQVVRDLPVDKAKNGALIVDDHFRLPEYPEVYVVGDSAWAFDPATGDPLPPTAQAAEHEGRYVARAIAASLGDTSYPPFHFRPKGHLALLGHRTGVAQVGPVTLSGIPAWLLWHSYYVWHIPSWRSRLHLLTDWLLAFLTGRETGQIPLEPDET